MYWRPLLVCFVLCIILELTYTEDNLSREERGARRGNRNRKNKKKGCKYERPSGSWGDCIEGKKSVNVTLVRSARGQTCEPFKIIEKDCRDRSAKKSAKKAAKKEARKVARIEARKEARTADKCRYKKKGIKWSDCTNGEKTKVLNLTSGTNCNQTKTITKTCRQRAQRVARDKGCKYDKGTWTDCVNGKRTRTRTLKTGSPSTCQAQLLVEKDCKDKADKNGCQYDKGTWTDCVNGKRSRTKTLKADSPTTCVAQMVVEKDCKDKKKKDCKYQPDGQGWGPCTSGQKVKTLTLKPGSPAECEASKSLRKRCKLRECKYKKGTIGICNQETGMLNRTDDIKDNMDASCPPTKEVEVPCNKPNARPKACKYGPWGEYGPCMNGVKRKSREITMGQLNQQCQKKAVKIMACEDQSDMQGGFK